VKNALFIDNRSYSHNSCLHIDFIKSMHKNKIFNIIGYGNFFDNTFTNYKVNKGRVFEQIIEILHKHKIDFILTYNSNGSSYESHLDNIGKYSWISDCLSKIDVPKFHVTTDYCRGGFVKAQAEWFDYVGYSAAFFRHKSSLNYDLNISKYWLPFSVDKNIYLRNSVLKLNEKKQVAGFIGTAADTCKEIYKNRIEIIKFFEDIDFLKTPIIKRGRFEILTGRKYVKFLSNNMFNITCGGNCGFLTAKYIEIQASNSIVIGPKVSGCEILNKDMFFEFDIENLNNNFNKLNYYLKNKEFIYSKFDHKSFVLQNSNNERSKYFKKIILEYL